MFATVELAPAYSFGCRVSDPKPMKSPGPAAYSLPSTVGVKKAGPVMGTRFKDKRSDTTPSPVAYQATKCWETTVKKAPNFSFGRRFKLPAGDKTPGSGDYNPKTREVLSKAPGYTMRHRVSRKTNNQCPGPAAYETHKTWHVTRAKTPSFSISKRVKDLSKMSTPGPNAYKPKLKNRKRSPSYSMRPRTQGSLRNAHGPGPAAYDLGSQFGRRR